MSIQHRFAYSQAGLVQIPRRRLAKGTAMNHSIVQVIAASVLLAASVNRVQAQIINETGMTFFPTPELAIQRTFGQDVATDGLQKVAIGAPTVGLPRVGRVLVYDTEIGNLVHEIMPPASSISPFEFGNQVEISGSTLVVSTQRQVGFNNPGQVFVHDLVTGDFLFELTPTNALGDDVSFGYDIAIDGNVIAVGQPDYDGLRGCVYLFDANDGSQIDVIYSDAFFPGVDFPRFGDQVVLSNGKLAVSHVEFIESVTPSVFIFDATTRSLLHTMLPTIETQAGDRWGDAIAMNADTLIVCAPGDDPFGEDSGSVYAYDTSTGQFRARLDLVNTIPGGATGLMEMDAEINENGLVAVYSSGRVTGDLGAGSVDLFDSTTGTHVGSLEPAEGNPSRSFGSAIAFDAHLMYVADTFSGTSGTHRVYQFSTGATITMNPASYVLDTPQFATMQISAPNGTSYRWFKDGEIIEDDSDYTGTTTDTLIIYAGLETAGAYTCRVSSVTSSDVYSEPGYLVYQGAASQSCPADFTGDEMLDIFDVFGFLDAFNMGCP